MGTHRELKGIQDSICVDCEFIYECTIKEGAEDRENHVTECSQFTQSVDSLMIEEVSSK